MDDTAKPAKAALEADKGPGGIYFGWYNVGISTLLVTLAVGATSYSFGLFIVPAVTELGLSRANANMGLVLFHLGSLTMNPLLGYLYDRVSYRLMLRMAGTLFMVGMVGAGLAQEAWLIGLCIVGPISFGTSGSAALPGMTLAARWFKAKRARAITTIAMGTSFGGMIVFPTIAFLLETYGWREALIIAGLVIGSVVWLCSFLVRSMPQSSVRAEVDKAKAEASDELTLSPIAVLRSPAFWAIAVPAAIMMAIDQTLLATFTPYMQDRGMDLTMASSAMVAMTSGAIAGKLLVAWIGDKVDLRYLFSLTALFGLAQCVLLYFDPSFTIIVIGMLLTGMAIGGTYPIASSLMSKQFGALSTGTALGLQSPLISGASSVALYFIGASFDTTGSYHFAFLLFGGIMLLASMMVFLIPKQDPTL